MWIQEKKISKYVSMLRHFIWPHPKYLIIINTFPSSYSTFTNVVSPHFHKSTLQGAVIEMPHTFLVWHHLQSIVFPGMSPCNLQPTKPLLCPTPLSSYPLPGFCTDPPSLSSLLGDSCSSMQPIRQRMALILLPVRGEGGVSVQSQHGGPQERGLTLVCEVGTYPLSGRTETPALRRWFLKTNLWEPWFPYLYNKVSVINFQQILIVCYVQDQTLPMPGM